MRNPDSRKQKTQVIIASQAEKSRQGRQLFQDLAGLRGFQHGSRHKNLILIYHALGHHDLLPANFLDDGSRLWLIDWEYGAFGTAMFDLASIAANNSFDRDGERLILERYFERDPSEALWRAFHAMKAASALREAVWGMISELHLNAPGVDYVAYAAEYLGRFERVYSDYTNKFGKS